MESPLTGISRANIFFLALYFSSIVGGLIIGLVSSIGGVTVLISGSFCGVTVLTSDSFCGGGIITMGFSEGGSVSVRNSIGSVVTAPMARLPMLSMMYGSFAPAR